MKRHLGFLIEFSFILIASFLTFVLFVTPNHPVSRKISGVISVVDIRLARSFFIHMEEKIKSLGKVAGSFGQMGVRGADRPQCRVKILKKPNRRLVVDEDYEIIMELSNAGADSTEHKKAFSGMHVEVVGADVRLISTKRNIRRSGETKWFEVKLGRLKKNEAKKVVFSIRPRETPVRIYYRGWVPGDFTAEMAQEIKDELVGSYKDSGGWRNENAISRFPENDSVNSPMCPVKVKAAHKEAMHFRCAELILE